MRRIFWHRHHIFCAAVSCSFLHPKWPCLSVGWDAKPFSLTDSMQFSDRHAKYFLMTTRRQIIRNFLSFTKRNSYLLGSTRDVRRNWRRRCCIDETLQGRIQEFALGATPPLLFSLPSPLFPSPLTFPSLPLSAPRIRSRAPLKQLGGLEERCKHPQRAQPKTSLVHSKAARKPLHGGNCFQYFGVGVLPH